MIFNAGLAGDEALEAGGRGGEVGQGAEREGGGGAPGIEGARGPDHPLHGREETIAGKSRRRHIQNERSKYHLIFMID